MIRYIVKRSGDKVSFDARKIKSAIFKANTRIAAERMSDADLNELTEEVLTALEKLPGTPTAQEIQNVVEEKLLAADYSQNGERLHQLSHGARAPARNGRRAREDF